MYHRNNTYYRSRSKRAYSLINGLVGWLRKLVRARHDSISPRFLLFSLLVFVLGTTLCSQVVWHQIRKTRLRYQINQLQEKNHRLRMQVHKKKIAVSRLQRLDRIQRIAVAQLGMKLADTVPALELSRRQWVQLPEGGGGAD